MEIRYAKTASRHHISRAPITYVVHNAVAVVDLGAPDNSPTRSPRSLHLGADGEGVMLEVMSVEGKRGDLFLIHAMQMRRRYCQFIYPIH